MSTSKPPLLTPAEVARGKDLLDRLRAGLGTVLFGQDDLLDLAVLALAARGHLLIEGLPGLGKTELVKALGHLLGLTFARVQFTPDLLPSDITGGPVLEEREGQRAFVFRPGPLFAHLVLADEINRASPKTQSALLEAMQEHHVTVLGESHALPRPFFVLATQNPIELEGTYPLPEAQLDRFLFKVEVPVPADDVLRRILQERRHGQPPTPPVALTAEDLTAAFATVDRVFLPEPVADYIARVVGATHPEHDAAPAEVKRYVRHGASPRAAIAIAEAARACALRAARPNVDFTDVERVAVPALAHRLVLDHTARLDRVRAADLIAVVLAGTSAVARPLPGELD